MKGVRDMSNIRSTPRSVILRNDIDWTQPDISFDSCSEAITFLWDKIGRSRTWRSVSSSFHYACDRDRSLFGYRFLKNPEYVRGYFLIP